VVHEVGQGKGVLCWIIVEVAEVLQRCQRRWLRQEDL